MAELQKQLSAQSESSQAAQGEADDPQGSKAPVASPFAREACNTPWDRVMDRGSRQSWQGESRALSGAAQDPSSRQQTPNPAQQPYPWPSAVQANLKGLIDAAPDQHAKQSMHEQGQGSLQGNLGGQPTEEKAEVANSMEVQSGANPISDRAASQRAEPQKMDWGPFTGLGSNNLGGAWSNPGGHPLQVQTPQSHSAAGITMSRI